MSPSESSAVFCQLSHESRGREHGHEFCIYNGGNTGDVRGIFNEYLVCALYHMEWSYICLSRSFSRNVNYLEERPHESQSSESQRLYQNRTTFLIILLYTATIE